RPGVAVRTVTTGDPSVGFSRRGNRCRSTRPEHVKWLAARLNCSRQKSAHRLGDWRKRQAHETIRTQSYRCCATRCTKLAPAVTYRSRTPQPAEMSLGAG